MFSRRSRAPFQQLAAGTMLLAAGCNVTGSWRVAETKPEGAPFPFQQVLFDPSGKFTTQGFVSANGEYTGKVHTIQGEYLHEGADIRMTLDQGAKLLYKTRRRLNGQLVMTLRLPNWDQSVTAILVPAGVASPQVE